MKFTLSLVLLLGITASASAHANLKQSNPAANASVKTPARIVLQFAEKLEPAFSGATLFNSTGKPVPAPSVVSGDTVTIVPAALKPGAYSVKWHSVGHDTHRLTGSFGFKIIP